MIKILFVFFTFLISSYIHAACLNNNDCGIGYYCRLQNGQPAPEINNISEGLCVKKTDKSSQSGAVQGGGLRSGTSGLPPANPSSSENSTPYNGSKSPSTPPSSNYPLNNLSAPRP